MEDVFSRPNWPSGSASISFTCLKSKVVSAKQSDFRSVVLDLVGGSEPHQFHTGVNRNLLYPKIKCDFSDI